jgi:hypothetical protein
MLRELTKRRWGGLASVLEVFLEVGGEESPAADQLATRESTVGDLALDSAGCHAEQQRYVAAGIRSAERQAALPQHVFEQGMGGVVMPPWGVGD